MAHKMAVRIVYITPPNPDVIASRWVIWWFSDTQIDEFSGLEKLLKIFELIFRITAPFNLLGPVFNEKYAKTTKIKKLSLTRRLSSDFWPICKRKIVES